MPRIFSTSETWNNTHSRYCTYIHKLFMDTICTVHCFLTSRRKIFLMWSGFLALKCKVRGRDELGETTPSSWDTLNSSPNSSRPCSLQDTGKAVLLRRFTLQLANLESRMKKIRVHREKDHWCCYSCDRVFWLYYASSFFRGHCALWQSLHKKNNFVS